jgi:hypothetical protein
MVASLTADVGNFTNAVWDFPLFQGGQFSWPLKNNDIFELARSLQ